MRTPILIFIALCLSACHSQKSSISTEVSLMNDTLSVSRVENETFSDRHFSSIVAMCDSVIVHFNADSIDVDNGVVYNPEIIIDLATPYVSATTSKNVNASVVSVVDSVRHTQESVNALKKTDKNTVIIAKPNTVGKWVTAIVIAVLLIVCYRIYRYFK